MAEGPPVRAQGLPLNSDVSSLRNLWPVASVSTRGLSIAANIAEGFKKRGKADKLRYFNIAQGSIEESRYSLILAEDLQYGDVDEWRRLLEEVSKLLEAYSRAILNSDS